MRKKNGTSVSASDILAIVQSRSDWSARATSVTNPERCASITDGKLKDSSGTVLRAYVNSTGLATLETNEEYRVRKGIRSAAKTARKSGSTPAPAPAPASVDPLQAQIAALQAQIAALTGASAPPAPAPAPAPSVKPGMTASATKNASLSAIDRKLETLGETREYVERNTGYALTSATVDQLRGINRVLGERIAKNAQNN